MSQTLFEKLANDIESYSESLDDATSEFYSFEPWDIEKRPDWVYKEALKDGIDLQSGEIAKVTGDSPKEFQTGYMFSSAFLRAICAANQIGKSIVARTDALIRMTGEIPIALRFEKGADTGIKRLISQFNIQRWGRRDSSTGEVIDYDVEATIPEGWSEWDCGNIVGAGVYPSKKILGPGSTVWIGTYMRAMLSYWWPSFYSERKSIPESFIDVKRGNKGYKVDERTVFLVRDSQIDIITYESGFERFEAKMVEIGILDEEPPNEKIYQSMQQHARSVSMVETPYMGVTWSRKYLLPASNSAQHEVFHATQFDSPYQLNKDVEIKRSHMPNWERGSRVWGIPTEVTGEPYYHRDHIMSWINKFTIAHDIVRFIPSNEYDGVNGNNGGRGLLDVVVNTQEEIELDQRYNWKMYDDVRPRAAYVIVTDPAEGGESPEEAGDMCAAQIWRLPIDNERLPILCASLRSTMETIPFARTTLLAARYYNNAVMASETRRGFANATFFSETKDWPFWYRMVTMQESTGKARSIMGFDTNARTRGMIFDLIGKWLSEYEAGEYPNIPDKDLLQELAAAVKGKGGRCDHTKQGSLDSAVCFGIFLYVYENSPEQITCNAKSTERLGFIASQLAKMGPEKPVSLGTSQKNWRA